MSSGGLGSWPSRPCEWPAKRLRGRPVSRTVTLRRARPSCRAPARPAKLPPMMMTSSMVMGCVLWIDMRERSRGIPAGGKDTIRQVGAFGSAGELERADEGRIDAQGNRFRVGSVLRKRCGDLAHHRQEVVRIGGAGFERLARELGQKRCKAAADRGIVAVFG